MASDLNPVMLVIAKAPLLDTVEADHIEPLAAKVIERSRQAADALSAWFMPGAAATIRSVETAIREHVVGPLTLGGGKPRIGMPLDK